MDWLRAAPPMVAVIVATACAGAPSAPEIEQAGAWELVAEFETLLLKYEQSVNDLDLELAEEIWSQEPGVSFIQPRGHQRGWDDIRQSFYLDTMGSLPTRRLQVGNFEVHRLTENSAWVEFYWEFEAVRPNGGQIKSAGRETQVYRRENGAWKIRHVHYSGLPTQVEGEGF